MKKDLHPEYKEIEVACTTCENKFVTHSTSDEIKVDVCSNCHPFYTGKQTTGGAAGRIDRFNQRFAKKEEN
jgi:large subunit ribosomal protein L31